MGNTRKRNLLLDAINQCCSDYYPSPPLGEILTPKDFILPALWYGWYDNFYIQLGFSSNLIILTYLQFILRSSSVNSHFISPPPSHGNMESLIRKIPAVNQSRFAICTLQSIPINLSRDLSTLMTDRCISLILKRWFCALASSVQVSSSILIYHICLVRQ